jgi:hypothetical protein
MPDLPILFGTLPPRVKESMSFGGCQRGLSPVRRSQTRANSDQSARVYGIEDNVTVEPAGFTLKRIRRPLRR